MLKYLFIAATLLMTFPASAQTSDQQRQLRALPSFVEQREQALNGLAICRGDVGDLQAKIADLNKQIADLKAKLPAAAPAEEEKK